MKKVIVFCALLAGVVACSAQTVIDHFIVGPYVVDYNGQDDVNYRLKDNIDLYEYFDLQRDTTIVISQQVADPVKHAIQISAVLGANLYTTKEFGVEGLWKQNIANNLYFNGGLSFLFDYTAKNGDTSKRSMFELGVPLQIELSNLDRRRASFYGLFGISPTFYSTLKTEAGSRPYDGKKKSGMLVAPSLEVGCNVPVGTTIVRLGVYGKYKINCSTSGFDVYKDCVGRAFIGGKISVVI